MNRFAKKYRGNGLKRLSRVIVILMLLICCAPAAFSQELLSGKKAQQAAAAISKDYKNWKSAGWNAKLKSDKLPVSVSVKSYFLCDSLTMISFRVPLFGEVARVEIDNKNLYVINKSNKKYYRVDLTNYGKFTRRIHSNIQDILIGRVTLVGEGTLSKTNYKSAEIFTLGESTGWLVAARLPEELVGVGYGYGLDAATRIVSLMVTMGKPYASEAPDGMESESMTISTQFTADIVYNKNNANANLTALFRGKNISAKLEDIQLEFGVKGFDRINLSKGYTSASLRDIMKF